MKKQKRALTNIAERIRPALLQLEAYQASPTTEQLMRETGLSMRQIAKLNTAENPYTDELYRRGFGALYSMYPDPHCWKLREAIGGYTGYAPGWIGCGNGSDELIDLLIALLVAQEEEIIVCPPTFPMYEFFAKVRGVKIKRVLRKEDLSVNVDEIKKKITSKTKIVFIDSPGNPSGTTIRQDELTILLEEGVMVAVDEAYFEYCGKTVAGCIKQFSNLVVLRTFSKWAGLAGARIGYMIANPKITSVFQKIKPPYNVNTVAQELAIFALKNKERFLSKLTKLLSARDYLVQNLTQFDTLTVWPGEGPYVIAKVKAIDCEELAHELRSQGVLVKSVKQPLLENTLLVSISSKENIDLFIKSLKNIFN